MTSKRQSVHAVLTTAQVVLLAPYLVRLLSTSEKHKQAGRQAVSQGTGKILGILEEVTMILGLMTTASNPDRILQAHCVPPSQEDYGLRQFSIG